MNEKRFEVDVDHLLLVWDTEKNKRLEIEDIVDLLNSLSEENEQLKQEKDKYRVMINANASLNDEVYEQLKKTEKSYKECREENERLKSRNSYNVEDMQMEIGELKEENEQLRQKLDFYLLDEFEWKEKYGD